MVHPNRGVCEEKFKCQHQEIMGQTRPTPSHFWKDHDTKLEVKHDDTLIITAKLIDFHVHRLHVNTSSSCLLWYTTKRYGLQLR